MTPYEAYMSSECFTRELCQQVVNSHIYWEADISDGEPLPPLAPDVAQKLYAMLYDIGEQLAAVGNLYLSKSMYEYVNRKEGKRGLMARTKERARVFFVQKEPGCVSLKIWLGELQAEAYLMPDATGGHRWSVHSASGRPDEVIKLLEQIKKEAASLEWRVKTVD